MTDFVWPNIARMSSVDWRHISNSESSPAIFTGSMQTASRPGDRLGCTVRVENSTGAERAVLRAFAAKMRGRAHRVWLSDLSHTGRRRGTFPAAELFTNADFSNGTDGWSSDTNVSLSAADGALRLSYRAVNPATQPQAYQALTLTQYAPYCVRAVLVKGRGLSSESIGPRIDGGSASGAAYSTTRGYGVASAVTLSASGTGFAAINFDASGFLAGDYLTVPFVSAGRCFLIDGGGNLLLRSDEINNASWSKTNCSVGTDAALAPDGSTSAETISEDSSVNTSHYVSQVVTVGTAALDVSFSVSVRANNRQWIALQIIESAASHVGYAFFNLSGAGAVGTVSTSGVNISNVRAVLVDQGAGWFRATLSLRKTSVATTLTAFVIAGEGDNDTQFTGLSQLSFTMWRACLTASSVPSRGTATTAAIATASNQRGPGIHVKGLPVAQAGLLKAGDQVEIDKQIKFVTADLDSDASGCAYLEIDSPLAREVADNTPVIVEKPMAKFIMVDDAEYPTRPGDLSDFTFSFVQDLAP